MSLHRLLGFRAAVADPPVLDAYYAELGLTGDMGSGYTGSDGGAVVVAGSRPLVHPLLGHGLVDELRLMVFPVVLGSGRRLFPDDLADKSPLQLVDSKVFDNGVTVQTYEPAR